MFTRAARAVDHHDAVARGRRHKANESDNEPSDKGRKAHTNSPGPRSVYLSYWETFQKRIRHELLRRLC